SCARRAEHSIDSGMAAAHAHSSIDGSETMFIMTFGSGTGTRTRGAAMPTAGIMPPHTAVRTPRPDSSTSRRKKMPPRPAGPRAFPSTRWSRILAQPGPRDLEALAQAYWRPIHAFFAARLRLHDDAARDLVQDAFAWMLATKFFDRADPARGRFRGLLKKALA